MSVRKQNCKENMVDVRVAISRSSSEEPEPSFGKKIKYGNRIQEVWAVLSEFFSNSTIHGVRYFSENRRHWTERVWWIIAFGVSSFYCGTLIYTAWIKWNLSFKDSVSFVEKPMPIWKIPFPAVTVCPQTISYKNKFNFTDAYNQFLENRVASANVSKEMKERLEAVIHICNKNLFYSEFCTVFSDESIFRIIQDIAPSIYDIMLICRWRSESNLCAEFFQPIFTEDGVCYSFNDLNSRDIYREEMSPEMMSVTNNQNATYWDLDVGYGDRLNDGTESYPYRVFSAGAGLYAFLNLYEQDLDYMCREVQGFKVVLHTPGEVPQVSKHSFHVPTFQYVKVSVKPNIITTSDVLRKYEPNQRQCFFNSERKLRFLKVYTQRNCELECLSNFTKNMCGCVQFSLPRDTDTPICGANKIPCYTAAEDKILEQELHNETRCNCLPACISITYDVEISQAKFDWVSELKSRNIPKDEVSGMQMSRLSIFFKDHQFISKERSELHDITVFLATCGGLLGLFMGVSVLSVVEVIYYFTIRLNCTLRMRRTRENLRKRQKNRIAPAEKNIPTISIKIP